MKAKQLAALQEVIFFAHASAANLLAKLIPDGAILASTPQLLSLQRHDVPGLFLGGSDERLTAAKFSIEGDGKGSLWWILRSEAASTLKARIQRSNRSGEAALSEAANIVASGVLSGLGTMTHGHYFPSTPELVETRLDNLFGHFERTSEAQVMIWGELASQNAPFFSGQLVLFFDVANINEILSRLGV
jgi:chemotaxis protein CheY-P-specific phosphatase CheC